jgi:pilus assembly protein Flp/PilA
MKKILTQFAKDSSGATALEYGIMAGLISAVIIGAVTTVGQNINTVFTNIGAALTAIAA